MSETQSYPPYSMILEWDARSGVFVVTVPELPGCRTHGRTYEEAVRQGQDAIATWLLEEPRASWPAPRDFAAREQAEQDALPAEVRAAYEALGAQEMARSGD
jgi:predicted RNase H-like HicB family nuclease